MAIFMETPRLVIDIKHPTAYPKLDKGILAARCLYDSLDSPAAMEHVERVLGIALRTRVVEPDRFNANSEPEINERLLYIICCHLLNRSGLEHLPAVPEHVRRYGRIKKGLEDFFLLRDMNLGYAPLDRYADVLQRLPEALLAMLADVAEYHNPLWRRVISGLSHKALFDVKISMDEEQARIARIGRLLYAPLADFLGHRQLSGDILEVAAVTLFRDTFNEVSDELASLREELCTTRQLTYCIAQRIQNFCESEGIDADITFRPEKNKGKIIEKVRYYRSANGQNRPTFSVRDLSDLQAFKVVIKGVGGRKLNEDEKIRLVYKIEEFVQDKILAMPIKEYLPGSSLGPLGNLSLKGLSVKVQTQDYFRQRKRNNYRAIHNDFKIPGELQYLFVNFEIQLITEEGDFWARKGGAAHFAYNATRYGGTDELKCFTATWAEMMGALRTGREDVFLKYLVPSVDLTTVRVMAIRKSGAEIVDTRIDIPANRIVADALIKAGVDIIHNQICINGSNRIKLETVLGDIQSISAIVSPIRHVSDRYVRTLLTKCGEVETAVTLAQYLRSARSH